MKFVKFVFNSAKLVIDRPVKKKGPLTSEHHISDITNYNIGQDARYTTCIEDKYFVKPEEPVVFSPITNMLHVLLGARPASRFRTCLYERNAHIDEIARGGYFKLSTPLTWLAKSGSINFITENCQGKKSSFQSGRTDIGTVSPDGYISEMYFTWAFLKKRFLYRTFNKKFTTEDYHKLLEKIEELTGIEKPWDNGYTIMEAFKQIAENGKKDEFDKFLGENTDAYRLVKEIFNKNKNVSFHKNQYNSCSLTNNQYPMKKATLCGEFIFPMEDEDYENLMKGPRCATYLDNGMVSYAGLVSRWDIEEDFEPIKNLPE